MLHRGWVRESDNCAWTDLPSLSPSLSSSHFSLCLSTRDYSIGKQTDYISLKENVLGMSQQLNKITMEDMMVAATNLSSAPLSNTQQFNGAF